MRWTQSIPLKLEEPRKVSADANREGEFRVWLQLT